MRLKKSIMKTIDEDRSEHHISRLLNDSESIPEMYAILDYLIQFGHPQGEHYKLANNTHVERRPDNSIAVRLHQTDVVTYHPGKIVLRAGGWYTMTTKDRIQRFSPASIWSSNHLWTVHFRGSEAVFSDGMTLTSRPPYICGGMDDKEVEEWRIRKQKVEDYCNKYKKHLDNGMVTFGRSDYEAVCMNPLHFHNGWHKVTESQIMRMMDHDVFHGGLVIAACNFAGYGNAGIQVIADQLYRNKCDGARLFHHHIRKFLHRKLAIA